MKVLVYLVKDCGDCPSCLIPQKMSRDFQGPPACMAVKRPEGGREISIHEKPPDWCPLMDLTQEQLKNLKGSVR